MSPTRDAARRLRGPSSSLFLVALGTVSDVVVQLEPDGSVAWVSPVVTEVLGYDPGDLVGMDPIALAHPAEAEGLRRLRTLVLMGEETADVPLRIRSVDGAWRRMLGRARPINVGGGTVGAILTLRDEHEAFATQRALATLLAGTRVLVAAEHVSDLPLQVCRVVVAEGGYRFAWFGVPAADPGKPVRVVAQAGDDRGYIDCLEVSWDENDPRGRGPVGKAVRTRATQVRQDIIDDPGFAPWLELAREHDIRSMIALPVVVGDEVLGVLAVYADEVSVFTPQAQQNLETLAGNIGYGIARLHEAERRLAVEERFRLMAENSSDVVILSDETLTWTWASPAAEVIMGWRPDQLVGRRGVDFMHPDDIPPMVAMLESAGPEGEMQMRLRCRRPDGTYRWLEGAGSGIHDAEGRFLGRVLALRDIESVMRAEQELRASEELFRRIAESSVDILFDIEDDRIKWVSPSVKDKLGWAPEELTGRDPDLLFVPGAAAVVQRLDDALASGTLLHGTFPFRHRDGSEVLLDVRARPFTSERGGRGLTGSARIVPERRGAKPARGRRRADD